MFIAIRRQLNPASAMAFVAMVFAMTSGAYAVSSGGGGNSPATARAAKSKKKTAAATGKPGPRGPAGPKGQIGAAGAAGPAGPAGAKGETGGPGVKGETGATGAPGAAGTNGKDGESATVSRLEPEEGGCVEGGTKFTAGGKEATACNGEKGESGKAGFTKTLPPGATETGTFAVRFTGQEAEELAFQPVSFPIPLPIALGLSEVGGSSEGKLLVTREEQNDENGKTPPAGCTGTAEDPKAEKPALFCLYEGRSNVPSGGSGPKVVPGVLALVAVLDSGNRSYGTASSGAMLQFNYSPPTEETPGELAASEKSAFVAGTWAVTAP